VGLESLYKGEALHGEFNEKEYKYSLAEDSPPTMLTGTNGSVLLIMVEKERGDVER
jgi:hypothetical protein